MKRLLKRVVVVARNPIVRPVEVWALRALIAWVSVKLGVDLAHHA